MESRTCPECGSTIRFTPGMNATAHAGDCRIAMTERITDLTTRVAHAEQERDAACSDLMATNKEIERLDATLAALRRYAKHQPTCSKGRTYVDPNSGAGEYAYLTMPCDCGLDTFLAAGKKRDD